VYSALVAPISTVFAQAGNDTEAASRDHGKMQQVVTSAVVSVFQQGHFSKPRLSDASSRMLYDEYFETLDPNKVYFTSEDIEEFSPYREILDDLLLKGNIDFPFKVYKRFLLRVQERVEYARERVKKGFDFSKDETMGFDRSEKPWASPKELDEIWEKRVKKQMLVEYMMRESAKEEADKEKSATASWLLKRKPNEAVLKRYENYFNLLNSNDTSDVLENFISSFMRVFDPHSNYLSWRSLEDFDISMRLSLQGIGATLTNDDGYTKVVSIVAGGPADKDGRLKPGDRIVAVAQDDKESQDVVNVPLNKVVRQIRGKKETIVRLTVISSLDSAPREIVITRGEVKLEDSAATGELKTIKDAKGVDHNLGYVYLPGFYADWDAMRRGDKNPRAATGDVKRLVEELQAKHKIEGLVLDLRGNGGGSLQEAIKLAGLFIPTGPVVQVRDGRNKVEVHQDDDNGFVFDLPLVVMVDRTSASASEIFAGAIQDYGRGIIVGDKSTHGKGTVQTVWRLGRYPSLRDKKPGALKFTMAKFYRVTGASTQKKGVTPDIIFPSFFDHMEVGEARLSHVMPWDEIKPQQYDDTKNNIRKFLPKVKADSAARVAKSEKMQPLFKMIKDYGIRQKDKTLTLSKAKRLAKRKEDEKWTKLVTDILFGKRRRKSDDDKDKPRADLSLDEANRILADLIIQVPTK